VAASTAWSLACHPLDWQLSAAEVLRLVRGDAHPAALTGAWAGGSDIVCSEPAAVHTSPGLPWQLLDACWPTDPSLNAGPAPVAVAKAGGIGGGPGFGGGWIGYLGFGLADAVLPVPPAPGGPRRLPPWWLGFYDHVLRRDRKTGQWFFEALRTPERAGFLDERLAELRSRAYGVRPGGRGYACGDFCQIPSAAEHMAAVRRAVEYIRQGDIFQANICLRLEAEFDGDPLDAFCAAVSRLDPPYAGFLGLAGGAVASLSPELFLRREGAAVRSRPVKGTQARPADPAQAAAERAALERSAKNRAENVMIVDLMRSDLSQVCEPGSVQVPRLTAAEPHPGIWHLVSDVTGRLRPGVADGRLVRATFPPGSVTGAPKVRSVEVIHELEATPREVYTGAVGYRSPVAGLELNVAIRTFEFHGGRVWLGAGGGIVAASRPGREYDECLLKAAPLIKALTGRSAIRPSRRDARYASPARQGAPLAGSSLAQASLTEAMASPLLRPRPAAGVFTSLLVTEGRTCRLGDHLSRLEASARELFGKSLPPALGDDLARCLALRPTGRLRITVRPLGGPLRAVVEVVPRQWPAPVPTAADLYPVTVPGGLGRHKWADRRLLAHAAWATSARAAFGHLLIQDDDGYVLETDRSNIFAVTRGVLTTPPADGRLLPGITRAHILALAKQAGVEINVAPVHLRELMHADEAFVTNSVYGIVPVRRASAVMLPPAPGPVTARLTAALAADPAETPGSCAVRPGAAFSAPGLTVTTAHASHHRLHARARPAVVVIDNYDSFTYNLVHQLIAASCAVEVVRNDEVTAGQVAAFGPAGVVISPGPCAPQDAGISIEVVRACAADTPVLGVCLGHQAIAACYGASIIAAPRPVHGQTATIVHDGRGFLAGLPQRFAATRYHSLVVDETTLPRFLTVTARTRGGIMMGLRHATLPVEGVQFHPESVLTGHGQAIIAGFARALTVSPARPAGPRRPAPASLRPGPACPVPGQTG
jgi:para-aminobenzoate synthetase / 4-amino-4-deoxychorismate lyase